MANLGLIVFRRLKLFKILTITRHKNTMASSGLILFRLYHSDLILNPLGRYALRDNIIKKIIMPELTILTMTTLLVVERGAFHGSSGATCTLKLSEPIILRAIPILILPLNEPSS